MNNLRTRLSLSSLFIIVSSNFLYAPFSQATKALPGSQLAVYLNVGLSSRYDPSTYCCSDYDNHECTTSSQVLDHVCH
ncbi:MAG: hypothetical protein H0U75_05460 [Legionella sp.]|nr:hypothetical protein [Legionella sp.]